MKHQGKIALVTGGTRGIGKAISLRLAEDGADIILNYKSDSETAEKTAAEIRAMGRNVWVFQADMRDDKAIRGLAQQVEKARFALDGSPIHDRNLGCVDRVVGERLYELGLGHARSARNLGGAGHGEQLRLGVRGEVAGVHRGAPDSTKP